MSSRLKLMLATAVVILLVGVSIFLSWLDYHPAIAITTDSLPVSFKLADKTYQLSTSQTTIRPLHGHYEYQAQFIDSKNQPIVLTGQVDSLENKSPKIVLSFSIFTDTAIEKALCSSATQSCIFNKSSLQTTYTNDYSWAAILIKTPGLEDSKAALKVVNGKWVVVAGPGTDISDSYTSLPPAVVEVLTNE